MLAAENRDVGISVLSAGTLDAEDLRIRDTDPDGHDVFGRGLNVQGGATATVVRMTIAQIGRAHV